MPTTDTLTRSLIESFKRKEFSVSDGRVHVARNASAATISALRRVSSEIELKPGGSYKDKYLKHESPRGVRPDVARWTDYIGIALANSRIADYYARLGGARSALGLPLSGEVSVQSEQNVWTAHFRGGTITLQDARGDAPPQATATNAVEVWWVALECVVKQENAPEDEVYGTVGVIVPSTASERIVHFPTAGGDAWDMGPDDERLVLRGDLLYDGPPANLNIVAQLVEQDEGSHEQEIKSKIAAGIAKLAQGFAALAGVPAEAVGASGGFINDVSSAIANAIWSVLGLGDDPYNPGALIVLADDIMQGRVSEQPPYHRANNDDPRTIAHWTHRIMVTGRDDEGDTGQYQFYFRVRPKTINQVLNA